MSDKKKAPATHCLLTRELVERLREYLIGYQDEGPTGAGWQSQELIADIDALGDALAVMQHEVQAMSETEDDSPDFLLVRFNPRRAMRGAPAAQVATSSGLLWMSRSEIKKNIRDFGDHPELWKAYEAYDNCVEYPPR